MSTTLPASLLSAPIQGDVRHGDARHADVRQKRVLLVDGSPTKRELRADAMRKFGIDVDCAADIEEARSWWKVALYDLVLVNMEKGQGFRDKFCADLRGATPPQRLAFLVGGPEFLANSPSADVESPVPNGGDRILAEFKVVLAADLGDRSQRWGILEASKRISAVRSASLARSQAMRTVPAPPRDVEGRAPKRIPTEMSLYDLLREELR